MLYFKNTETLIVGESSFFIDTIVVGIDYLATHSGKPLMTIIKNPSTGTLISGALAVSINSNRNSGSSYTLSSITYKGA